MINVSELQQLRFRRDQLRGDMNKNMQAVKRGHVNGIDRDMLQTTLQAEQQLMEAYEMRIKRMERLYKEQHDGNTRRD